MNSGNTIITFRSMDRSEVFDEYARKELKKLDKFLEHDRTPIKIELVIETTPTRNFHEVTLNVQTPRFALVTENKGYDIYLVIDEVINTMIREMRKEKEKMVDGREDNWRQIK